MRGVVYRGPRDVRLMHDLPEPRLRDPRDAVVRVTASAICGTDLHPYREEIPGFAPGTVLGHEFVGVVVAGGVAAGFGAGDRVVASDLVACGRCDRCARGWHYQCRHGTLFGSSTLVGFSLPGGQADYVRVPYADLVLGAIPPEVTDEQALFAADVLSTGYAAAQATGPPAGAVVAVVGGGPVGLCAGMCARVLGAGEVVVADPDPARRRLAQALGFAAVEPAGLARTLERTPAGAAEAVIEAVGSDAALRCAVDCAGPRATVVAAGAHHSAGLPFPAGAAFARELTVRFVVGDPIQVRDRVLALIRTGRLDPTPIVSHRLPLAAAARAYDLFDRRVATKVVLHP